MTRTLDTSLKSRREGALGPAVGPLILECPEINTLAVLASGKSMVPLALRRRGRASGMAQKVESEGVKARAASFMEQS